MPGEDTEENQKNPRTGLEEYLQEKHITQTDLTTSVT